MITNIILYIKNFPIWMKQIKKDCIFYYIEWIISIAMIFTLFINYFYFRNDFLYFIPTVGISFIFILTQSIISFKIPNRRNDQSKVQRAFLNFPYHYILFILLVSVPAIIYGNYHVGEEVYDEYFVYAISFLIIFILRLFTKFSFGLTRRYIFILFYIVAFLLEAISIVLAITI